MNREYIPRIGHTEVLRCVGTFEGSSSQTRGLHYHIHIYIYIYKYIYRDVYCQVTHPATEYTHATIELRMLFLVARQRPLNNSRQNTRCATMRGGGVFSAQLR
jgi:hypothetical protein